MRELVTPANACDLRTRFVTEAFNHRTSPGLVHIMLFCTKIRELLYITLLLVYNTTGRVLSSCLLKPYQLSIICTPLVLGKKITFRLI